MKEKKEQRKKREGNNKTCEILKLKEKDGHNKQKSQDDKQKAYNPILTNENM